MPYRRPSGIWYIDFTPEGYPHPIRRSTGLTSKRKARDIESMLTRLSLRNRHDVLDRIRSGDLHPARVYGAELAGKLDELMDPDRGQGRPLSEVAQEFVDSHPDDRLKYAIRRLLIVAPEDATVAWLDDPANLRALLRYYRDEGYAIRTEHREMSGVRQLVRQELGPERQREIFANVRLRPKPNDRMRYLERDEIERVREKAGDWWLVFGLYIATGMRRGELPERQRRDLDLNAGSLRIESGKSKRARRVVPLGGEILGLLRGWVVSQDLSSGEPLFPEVTYNRIGLAWNQIRVKADVEDATIHSLRHTYGVHMARAGMPLVELKRRMGHSKIETTMKYAEYAPTLRSEHYDRGLEGMGLSGGSPTIDPRRETEEGENPDIIGGIGGS